MKNYKNYWLGEIQINAVGADVDIEKVKWLKKAINSMRDHSASDRYAIVTENNIGNERWLESSGPIVMESYLSSSCAVAVIDRAKYIGDKYGRQMICRLEPIGDFETFEKLIEGEEK